MTESTRDTGTRPLTRLRRRRRRRRVALPVAAGVVLAAVAAPLSASAKEPISPSELITSELGVVTTANPLASAAGIEILREGGNAMDAAVAAAFAVGVVDFFSCGIGGGGFLVYRGADGTVDTLDFYERAPGKGKGYTPRRGYDEGGPSFQYDQGRGVAAIPGFVRGMEAAMTRYGSKTLARVIEPARVYAERGFRLSPSGRGSLQLRSRSVYAMNEHSDTDEHYYFAGTPATPSFMPKHEGMTIHLPEYADTLRRIQTYGADDFYLYDAADQDRTATKLLDAMDDDPKDPNDWTAEDLKTYRAHWREPVTAHYRDTKVIGVGGPSAGGTLLAETLNILDEFDLKAVDLPERLHLTVEAQRIAWTDRNAYYGDPGPPGLVSDPDDEFADVPPQLTSPGYARQRASEIGTTRVKSYPPGRFDGYTAWNGQAGADSGTAGIAVVDKDGNAVALNCSLGGPMGSSVTPKGVGFLLNHSTGFGPAGSPNAPAAGKAQVSSQSPTVVVRRGRPILVVGSVGGLAIPMAVLNTILHRVDDRAPLHEAVDRPRIDCCGYNGGHPDEPTARRDPTGADGCVYHQVCVEARDSNRAALEALRRVHLHDVYGEPGYMEYTQVPAAGVELDTGLRGSSSDPRAGCGPSAQEEDKGWTSSACYQGALWLHGPAVPS